MEVRRRAAVVFALELEHQHQVLMARGTKRRRRRRAAPSWWVRPWLTPTRRLEYGHYDQVMQELKVGDENAFGNNVRMLPETTQQDNSVHPKEEHTYEETIRGRNQVGVETIRHLATGDSYQTLQYNFRCG
ncbi:hypothetical protein DPMN_123867 [Dreissena polymorpha]|uniref:Uncharacterized protein n=1 Tax=Dreissena polymorpha TaxID=45954 RepID=A0A9D4JRY3_DREPO|nr:hypothetical protein DPMN_123867 [Dreissena polymorpha]